MRNFQGANKLACGLCAVVILGLPGISEAKRPSSGNSPVVESSDPVQDTRVNDNNSGDRADLLEVTGQKMSTAKQGDQVEELVLKLTDLVAQVSNHPDDCAGIVQVLNDWFKDNEAWMESLDYATSSANAETIEKLRVMSDSLGKLLAECYDSKEIPAILMKYSK